jgi:uncharacterized protein (TIGR02421 family)
VRADLHAVDAALVRLGAEIVPMRFLDPRNSAPERARFLESDSYKPQFTYASMAPDEYLHLRDELDSLFIDGSPLGVLFELTRSYLLKRLEMRRTIGTNDFASELYGHPSPDLVELATQILSTPVRRTLHPETRYGPELVLSLMEQEVRRYGLFDWKVRAVPGITSTNVESASRTVNIRTNVRYSMVDAKRLVVHEVQTHVLRAANGYLQPYRIFGAALLPGYLATEEGLALVNEERAGYQDPERLRVLAARVMAAHLARSTSFRAIYEELVRYGVSSDDAWSTTTRAKRGLADTAQPGGFIKDHVYLWGKLKLEQYIVNGGDLSLLYVGKIGLDHLDLIHQIHLRPPQYLPPSYL